MRVTKQKTRRRRRRNCYDRMRAQFLALKRQRRSSPAASASLQLLALFALIFGRLPLPAPAPVHLRYTPPPLSPAERQRTELARRLDVPKRYVATMLSQGRVPYSLLFAHIKEGGLHRRDAFIELRKRAPEASLDWLDHVQKWGLWSSLLLCHVRDGEDADTDLKLLKSTLAWIEGSSCTNGTPEPSDAGAGLRPARGGDDVDHDDDPQTPKP